MRTHKQQQTNKEEAEEGEKKLSLDLYAYVCVC